MPTETADTVKVFTARPRPARYRRAEPDEHDAEPPESPSTDDATSSREPERSK